MRIESAFQPLPAHVPACELGESPLWHPQEQALYWCDIPGRAVHRYHPTTEKHHQWNFDCEPASLAPLQSGGLLLAMRDGLWRFSPATGERTALAPPPYDPKRQRFNDGKADAQGRFWVGTLDDQREPRATLYCYTQGEIKPQASGIAVSNGLAFSPDGGTLYWADTRGHCIQVFDLNRDEGSLSRQRVFKTFPPRQPNAPLNTYGGRPDGAAVDVEGAYWVAMFEGRCLLRLGAEGAVLATYALPVQCATMPCFGGPDLRTLFVTTAHENRPAAELTSDPWAGRVLHMRVAVPGLPANFVAN
jgi:sugar lactone lactonase YvrE